MNRSGREMLLGAGGRHGGRGTAWAVTVAWCVLASVAFAAHNTDAVRVDVLDPAVGQTLLNFHTGNFATSLVDIGGHAYTQYRLAGEGVLKDVGAPALPRVSRSVVIPDDAAVAVRVVSSRYYDIPDVDIAPSKGFLSRTVNPAEVPFVFGPAYGQDAFYPGTLAELRQPYIMRDVRGVVVEVHPFQYNPAQRTVRVYTELTVEVYETGPGTVNVLQRRPSELSLAFHNLYSTHFLNYATPQRYTPLDEDGDLLIIAHDAWLANVQPLADHKNGIGINTTVVGVSTVGSTSTAIKSYIQNVYNTSDLAFVLLVGDSAQVATPTASGGASDPSYSKLAGSDDYPDIMVGRFSAESAADVDTQVQRTIDYENMPATQQDWFWRGMGVASNQGTGDDGEYDNEHVDNFRTVMLANGYTVVDQIYDPTGTAAQVTAGLNAGRGIINYCGHGSTTSWSSTGFSNTNVNALVNDNMLPFIVSVACVNGYFNGPTCFGEAWLRATHNGVPSGAIGAYMSSINQSWDPPMEGQDEFNYLYINQAYNTYGALCFAGSCSMMDDYGSGGVEMFDTWHIFGDPTLRVVGTVGPPHGLKVSPSSALDSAGPVGGPFDPLSLDYTLENFEATPIDFAVSSSQPWVTLSATGGTLPAYGTTTVTVSINSQANYLGTGYYADTVAFVNLTNGDGDTNRAVNLQVGGPEVVYSFPLDQDPGWAMQGQWAFGAPTGQGGSSYGNPDPNTGATGNYVLGVNLNGDYSTSIGGPYYVTAGPFDLTDITEVSVKFQRWLNSDYEPYVAQTVEVSNNGSSWLTIFSNGSNEITDSSWSLYEYDISAVADNQPTVYVRWGHEVGSSGAWAYSGWNLDDIEIWGLVPSSPQLQIVASDPADGTIDARRPHDPQTLEPEGWDVIDVTLSGNAESLDAADFVLTELCVGDNCDGIAPAIIDVTAVGNQVTLTLAEPIAPIAWTVLGMASGDPLNVVRLGFLPGDVDASYLASMTDVLEEVNYVNLALAGQAVDPVRCDIDRSETVGLNDILALIDLLNGEGSFEAYMGVGLPPMP